MVSTKRMIQAVLFGVIAFAAQFTSLILHMEFWVIVLTSVFFIIFGYSAIQHVRVYVRYRKVIKGRVKQMDDVFADIEKNIKKKKAQKKL